MLLCALRLNCAGEKGSIVAGQRFVGIAHVAHHPVYFGVEHACGDNRTNIYCQHHAAHAAAAPLRGIFGGWFREPGQRAAEQTRDGGITDALKESSRDDREQCIEIGPALVISHDTSSRIQDDRRFLARWDSKTDWRIAVVAELRF